MYNFKDLTGKKFHLLTVIKRHTENIGRRVAWVCKCDCGKEKIIKGDYLQQGYAKTCGCHSKLSERDKELMTKARIKKYMKIHPETGCWEWQGYIMSCGYGLTSHKGNKILAHRASWLVCEGEIPKNLCVLHKCDNRKCINPEHLFLGTKKDNTDDMRRKGRHKNIPPIGVKHGMCKLTEEKVLEIRRKSKEGKSNRELSKEYKIKMSQTYRIVHRQSWAHLIDPSEKEPFVRVFTKPWKKKSC